MVTICQPCKKIHLREGKSIHCDLTYVWWTQLSSA